MQYSTFLLDFDHTLFDSDVSEAAAFSDAMLVAGTSDTGRYESSYRRINKTLWAAVERGEITPQYVRTNRFKRLVEKFDLDADPQAMSDAYVAGLGVSGNLYAGAREVIEQLSEHAALALVTNGLSEVQRARIHRLDIDRYFDAIVISAEVGVAKPGTEIFDITFSELGFPPKETTLMVGDSLSSDILGGTNYGLATCWYNPAGKVSEPSDKIAHEISELDEVLRFAKSTEVIL